MFLSFFIQDAQDEFHLGAREVGDAFYDRGCVGGECRAVLPV